MAKIIDRRKRAMGGASKRKLSQIKNMAVHYSATATGNTATFENHWKNSRKWVTGGYHEVVLTNGDVELNYDANVISNGVLNHNTSTYHICYVGDGQPTKAQRKTLVERIAYNKNRLGINDKNVKGHREFSGASTQCPAVNVQNLVKETSGSTKPGKPSKPNKAANLTVDGKWGNSTTRELQKALGTPVDGIISKQPRNSVSQSLYGTTVQFGNGGSNVIVALQKKLKANADGKLGPATVRALQKHLGTTQDGKLSRPSLVVKALQRSLNAGVL